MNILFATEVIHPGGAETFVLRLAAAFKRRGHKAHLFIFYKSGLKYELVERLAPDVPLHTAIIPAQWVLQKLDGVLFRMRIDVSFQKMAIAQSLRRVLANNQIEVVHSNLLKSDEACLAAAGPQQTPVITTIHGDYLQFHEKSNKGVPIPLLNYKTKATNNLSHLRKVVCISDKQLNFFQSIFSKQTAGKLAKIYNGYESHSGVFPDKRSDLGIAKDDFVFGMVSRGIEEKGWERAIQSFLKLSKPNAYLVLVGGGAYLDQLAERYRSSKKIHFTGHSNDPLAWIQMFDVGLLPTTYPSESLPTVVIEYLYAGKPVIASEAGEIRNMLIQENHEAGVVTSLDPFIMIKEQTAAMNRYMDDPVFFRSHKENTSYCFQAFDMDACVERYEMIYQQAINEK